MNASSSGYIRFLPKSENQKIHLLAIKITFYELSIEMVCLRDRRVATSVMSVEKGFGADFGDFEIYEQASGKTVRIDTRNLMQNFINYIITISRIDFRLVKNA